MVFDRLRHKMDDGKMKKKTKKKKKKKKLKSISSLKKKVWVLFSRFIRLRFADKDGYNVCVTCGDRKLYTEFHAGHFIHGHSKATFLEETNVHPQCVRCNHFLSGNLIEYVEFMRQAYGQEEIDRLKTLSHQIWKPSRQELEELIKKYEKNEDII